MIILIVGEMQVPAEKRIKVADTLRLLFHYCNIVNLTLGLIVFGVGISLVLAPFPLPAGKDVSKSSPGFLFLFFFYVSCFFYSSFFLAFSLLASFLLFLF